MKPTNNTQPKPVKMGEYFVTNDNFKGQTILRIEVEPGNRFAPNLCFGKRKAQMILAALPAIKRLAE